MILRIKRTDVVSPSQKVVTELVFGYIRVIDTTYQSTIFRFFATLVCPINIKSNTPIDTEERSRQMIANSEKFKLNFSTPMGNLKTSPVVFIYRIMIIRPLTNKIDLKPSVKSLCKVAHISKTL